MKTHNVQQLSEEWYAARLGVPTASKADAILTPKTLKPSKQGRDYALELAIERITGEPANEFQGSYAADRGTELEPHARRWYASEHGVEVVEVGFCTHDDRSFGCSPDGLVGLDGGTEYKCALPRNHAKAAFDPDRFAAAHRGQVQSCLWVTGREWWDLVGFCPKLPSVVVRCTPDAEYIDALAEAVRQVNEWAEEYESRIRALVKTDGAAPVCPISGDRLDVITEDAA